MERTATFNNTRRLHQPGWNFMPNVCVVRYLKNIAFNLKTTFLPNIYVSLGNMANNKKNVLAVWLNHLNDSLTILSRSNTKKYMIMSKV